MMSCSQTTVEQGAQRLGISHYAILLDYLEEQGVARSRCLNETRVPAALLEDPEAHIGIDQELALIRLLLRELNDGFRHGVEVGLRQGLTAYGAWGLGVMSLPNARVAMQWAGRFAAMAFPITRYHWSQTEAGPFVELDYSHLPHDCHGFLIARDLASIRAIHQDVLPGVPVGVRQVHLPFEREAGVEHLGERFGCAVVCRQQRAGLLIDQSILEHPFPGNNPLTVALCERYCRDSIDQRHQVLGLPDRVRKVLLAGQGKIPSVAEVAKQFHRSERSFRRQLEVEGSGWRQLRSKVLTEQACTMLAADSCSIDQVAERLGYSERSAFCHAFKRWTGMSPSKYRSGQVDALRVKENG